MRRRIVALLAGGLLVGGYVGVAAADRPEDPGREHGLCTAYFNGQKNGHDAENPPPPFAGLEAAAETAEMTMFDYCSQFGIGGQPGQNGRFTECFDEDDETGNDACPSE